MSKSLADLRANPPVTQAERSVTICLAPHLVAEVQALTEELHAIPEPKVDGNGNPEGPPRRVGVGEDPRAKEIRDRLAVLLDEMAEHEGEMRLRAGEDGAWRLWVNEHPARDEGEPGHKRDVEVTGGYCDADALIEALGDYAYSWNGEPLADGDWDTLFKDSVGGPDKKAMANAVVTMHESRLDFRQWRSGLSDNLHRLSASVSPATSASVPADSTAGSPVRVSKASTKRATG